MNHFVYKMPPGRLTIVADDFAIKEIHFGAIELACPFRPSLLTNRAATELQEYFAGKRFAFDVPIDPAGSDFQRAVWNALLEIPYGEVRTYSQIASDVGKPKGYRAVGMACNKNPIPIIIPCHRVLGANGALTGYAGGLNVKQYLLKLETGSKKDRGR